MSCSLEREEKSTMNSEHIKCPVCLDAMDNPASLLCGHSGCKVCLKEWLKSKRECPTCRAVVPHGFQLNVNIALKCIILEVSPVAAKRKMRGRE